MTRKTYTLKDLEALVEKLAENPSRGRRKPLRKGMAVLVEGQPCVKVPLTKGLWAIVDAADAEMVLSRNWITRPPKKPHHAFYAYSFDMINHRVVNFQMHRFVLGLKGAKPFVDHINGDGLDNRKQNLRTVGGQSPNLQNRRKGKRADGSQFTSRFKGVSLVRHSKKNPWCVTIKPAGKKRIYVGVFSDEVMAAKIYDSHAKKLFGEFASTNF